MKAFFKFMDDNMPYSLMIFVGVIGIIITGIHSVAESWFDAQITQKAIEKGLVQDDRGHWVKDQR